MRKKIDGLSKKVPGEQLSYCFFKQQQKLTVGQQVCTQVVLVGKILRNICSQKYLFSKDILKCKGSKIF